MKNIITKIGFLSAIALFGFAMQTPTVLAATQLNGNPNDCKTVSVGNYTTQVGISNPCWSLSNVSATDGQVINVRIYMHNSGNETANGVYVRLSPQSSGPATTHTFSGSVSASNASAVSGSATISTGSKTDLTFGHTALYISGTKYSLPNGQNGSEIFSSKGLYVGNIPSTGAEDGSVVVSFNVKNASTPTPSTCSDGVDNEGDGYTDYPSDPDCTSSSDSENVYNAPVSSKPTATTIGATGVTNTSAVLQGTYTSSGSNTVAWFEYGTSTSTNQVTQTTSVVTGTNLSFTKTLSGLNPNTTYYIRFVVQNSSGSTESIVLKSFTTTGSTPTYYQCNDGIDNDGDGYVDYPADNGCSSSTDNTEYSTQNETLTIWTRGADDFTQNAAVLNGEYDSSRDGEVWFEYGTSYYNLSSDSTRKDIVDGNEEFFISISGLNEDTTYYYRAIIENDQNETKYGSILSFRTAEYVSYDTEPNITTLNATSVDEDSATLQARYDANGSGTTVWFKYGTSENSLNKTTEEVYEGTGSGNTSTKVTGLKSDTTYYFQAYARNSEGTVHDGILSFVTDDSGNNNDNGDRPDVETRSVSNVGTTYVTLRADYDGNGSDTRVWFEYGTSTNYGYVTSSTNVGEDDGTVSQTISGLLSNRTYYYRAIARNDEGTTYGDREEFYTNGNIDPNPPYQNTGVFTVLATSIGGSSATVNGVVRFDSYAPRTTWFEYGITTNLGQTTIERSIGSGTIVSFEQTLTGLNSSTTHYYRAVVRDQNTGNVYRGSILSFRTLGSGVVSKPVTTSTDALIQFSISNRNNDVCPKDGVDYIVTYKNVSTKTINNVAVRLTIPEDVVFEKTSFGLYSEAEGLLLGNVGALKSGEEKSFIVQGSVSKDARSGDSFITSGVLSYTNPNTSIDEEVPQQYSFTDVDNNCSGGNSLAAFSLFGDSSFLPQTLFGWLVTILAIFGLVFVGRKLYTKTN